MRSQISEGIVLRHYDYGEADRIVVILTREHGRIRGIAKNARKSMRRFGPALDNFARINIRWNPPKPGALSLFLDADILDLHMGLRDSLLKMTLAGYGVELIETITDEGEVVPGLFDLLTSYLNYLDGGGDGKTAKLLIELRLLESSGYIPHLLHCSECMRIFDEEEVAFDAIRGGSLCIPCAPSTNRIRVSTRTLGTFSRCLKTDPSLFNGFKFGDQTLFEGGAILHNALITCLHRKLTTASFVDELLQERVD